MSTQLNVTLSPEAAAVVLREANRTGASTDAAASAVVLRADGEAPKHSEGKSLADGADVENTTDPSPQFRTLYDRLTPYIGVIDSSEIVPGGANMSANTGKKFGDAMLEKHRKRQA
jgi:hypothetical protein